MRKLMISDQFLYFLISAISRREKSHKKELSQADINTKPISFDL